MDLHKPAFSEQKTIAGVDRFAPNLAGSNDRRMLSKDSSKRAAVQTLSSAMRHASRHCQREAPATEHAISRASRMTRRAIFTHDWRQGFVNMERLRYSRITAASRSTAAPSSTRNTFLVPARGAGMCSSVSWLHDQAGCRLRPPVCHGDEMRPPPFGRGIGPCNHRGCHSARISGRIGTGSRQGCECAQALPSSRGQQWTGRVP